MSHKNIAKTIFSGVVWSLIGQIGYMLVILLTNVILARMVGPNEFGQFSIIMFFIIIANIIVEGGIGGALVIKEDADDRDYSTAFLFNLSISLVLYLILFCVAPLIAHYYDNDKFVVLLRLSGLIFIINSFQVVNTARMTKEMKFRQKSFYRLFAVIMASLIGVYLAFLGYGIEALLLIQILYSLFFSIILRIAMGGFKYNIFDINSFRFIYSFGINTSLASLLNSFFDNVYQLILGGYFSINQAGFYYNAKRLQDVPVNITNMLLQGVFFSAMAKNKNDENLLILIYKKSSTYLSVLIALSTIVIYIYAKDILLLLYGKNWTDAEFYLQILAIVSFFYTQELLSRVLLKVLNKTRNILYLELLKKTLQLVTIVVGIYYKNISLLFYGFLLVAFVSYFFNMSRCRRLIPGLGYSSQLEVLKFCIIIFVCILLGTKFYEYRFSFFPALILIYVLSLHITEIFRIKREYILFKIIMNKSKSNG